MKSAKRGAAKAARSTRAKKPALDHRMEICLRLVHNEKVPGIGSGDVGQQLAPDLEAKPHPVQLARNAVLSAKHVKEWSLV